MKQLLQAYVGDVLMGWAEPSKRGWTAYANETIVQVESREIAEAWLRSQGAKRIVERWKRR